VLEESVRSLLGRRWKMSSLSFGSSVRKARSRLPHREAISRKGHAKAQKWLQKSGKAGAVLLQQISSRETDCRMEELCRSRALQSSPALTTRISGAKQVPRSANWSTAALGIFGLHR
jgi:hypothetical protein